MKSGIALRAAGLLVMAGLVAACTSGSQQAGGTDDAAASAASSVAEQTDAPTDVSGQPGAEVPAESEAPGEVPPAAPDPQSTAPDAAQQEPPTPGPTTNAAPVPGPAEDSPVPTPRPIAPATDAVTVRVISFDPATAQLVVVRQTLVEPGDRQPYLADDPADPSEQKLTLAPGAPIKLIFGPCGTRTELLRDGPIDCSRAELAQAVAGGSGHLYAELEVVGDSVDALQERYQA